MPLAGLAFRIISRDGIRIRESWRVSNPGGLIITPVARGKAEQRLAVDLTNPHLIRSGLHLVGKRLRRDDEKAISAALSVAREEFEKAQSRVERMSLLAAEAGVYSDGTITLAEARQLYSDARMQYVKALRCFRAFVPGV
jgi:hypothetical protein